MLLIRESLYIKICIWLFEWNIIGMHKWIVRDVNRFEIDVKEKWIKGDWDSNEEYCGGIEAIIKIF
jgi:hypothetical protein